MDFLLDFDPAAESGDQVLEQVGVVILDHEAHGLAPDAGGGAGGLRHRLQGQFVVRKQRLVLGAVALEVGLAITPHVVEILIAVELERVAHLYFYMYY